MPAEVIALYLGLVNFLDMGGLDQTGLPGVGVFLIGMAGTWLYLWRVQKVERHSQNFLSTLCFVLWAVSLPGGLFQAVPPAVRGIVITVGSFGLGLVQPPELGDTGQG